MNAINQEMTKEDFYKAQKALEAANVPVTSPTEPIIEHPQDAKLPS